MTASNVIESPPSGWGGGPSTPIGYVPVYTAHRVGQAAPFRASGPIHAPMWLRSVDVVAIVAALCAAHVYAVLRTFPLHTGEIFDVTLRLSHVLMLLLCTCVWSVTYRLFGVYGDRRQTLRQALGRLALACAIGACFTALAHRPVADAVAYHGRVAFESAVRLWGMAFVLSALVRTVRWGVRSIPFVSPARHVLIVGSGPRAVNHYQTLLTDTRQKYHVVGFVDTRRHPALTGIGATLIGRLHELEAVLTRNVVDEVYIALPLRSCYNEFQGAIHVCERVGVRAVYSVDAFDYHVTPPRYDHSAGGSPVATITPVVRDTHLPLKRAVDILVSGLALAILAPVFLIVAILVLLTSPGPVFFAQQRYGQHQRRFKLYKFRSMRVDAEEVLLGNPALWDEYRRNHFKLPEDKDPRLTVIGSFLRKTSLDELPQLWNVLRGDMSLIGPRPIVPAEIEHYGPFAALLLALKPGLTGAWVVHGRSAVGYPRRAEIELSYVRQWSLLHDLRILMQTIPAVLMGRGAH